jgi:Arc/MetJ-type ribon-helix-helix transcriptional regulator
MTITIPADVANVLAGQVEAGKFASTEQALPAAVSLLGKEDERQRKRDAFVATLREADEQISRGDFLDVDDAFDQVEVELFGKRLADE